MYHDVSIRGKGTSGDSAGNPQAKVLAGAGSEDGETREDGVVMRREEQEREEHEYRLHMKHLEEQAREYQNYEDAIREENERWVIEQALLKAYLTQDMEDGEIREDGVVMRQLEIVWYVPSDGSAEYGISYGHDIEIKLPETSLAAVLRRMKLEGWELMKYGQAMVMDEVCLDFYFQSPVPIYTLHDWLRDLES